MLGHFALQACSLDSLYPAHISRRSLSSGSDFWSKLGRSTGWDFSRQGSGCRARRCAIPTLPPCGSRTSLYYVPRMEARPKGRQAPGSKAIRSMLRGFAFGHSDLMTGSQITHKNCCNSITVPEMLLSDGSMEWSCTTDTLDKAAMARLNTRGRVILTSNIDPFRRGARPGLYTYEAGHQQIGLQ